MLWTHPLLLAGLGLLAAPVLVHLLMKVHGRKVIFSTLRFLPPTQPSRDRKKIRHWPLLLLRLLLLALLVAAFARPYWPAATETVTPRQRARAVLIVLDRSASMQAREGNGTRWDAALHTAKKLLGTLSATDRVAIVDFAGQAEILSSWGPASAAEQALAGLNATNEPGRLADGLRIAAGLLDQAPASPELVLISDLQKSSCAGIDAAPIPSGTRCEIEPVAGPQTANVAVMDIANKSAAISAVTVDLQNFSAQKQSGLPITCLLDRQPFFQGKIDLDANGATGTALPAVTTPGWHQLQVDLATDDALAGDNHFFAAAFVPPPIGVAVAEPHPEKKNEERESYFLTSALDPVYAEDNTTPPPAGPFNVTLVDPANLAALLASPARPPLIVLPPLAEMPGGLGGVLRNYVETGGGVLSWIDPGIDTLGYNNELGNLLPARVIAPETYADIDGNRGWRLGWWNRDSVLFGGLGDGGHGDLTLPQFKERMRLDLNPGAETLATFEDKIPFLLSRRVGQGQVLLVNSSADKQGSDWPIHKTFLPLVQRMAYLLARRDPRAGFTLGASLIPTRHGQLDLGPALAKQAFRLVPPAGAPVTVRTDDAGIVHDADLERPGCYEIRDARNEIQRVVAVNFPATESDLASYRPDEITNQLRFAPSGAPHLAAAGALLSRNEAWPWLLGSLLPLLLLELGWANRIRA